jgi:hypothetical protein
MSAPRQNVEFAPRQKGSGRGRLLWIDDPIFSADDKHAACEKRYRSWN